MSFRIHNEGLPIETPEQRRLRHRVTAGVLLGLVALVCVALFALKKSHGLWPVSTGEVLETRIVMAAMQPSSSGDVVLYRADARVAYVAAGQRYEQWMQVSQIKKDRKLLEEYVGRSGKTCTVQWNPANPMDATATLN